MNVNKTTKFTDSKCRKMEEYSFRLTNDIRPPNEWSITLLYLEDHYLFLISIILSLASFFMQKEMIIGACYKLGGIRNAILSSIQILYAMLCSLTDNCASDIIRNTNHQNSCSIGKLSSRLKKLFLT